MASSKPDSIKSKQTRRWCNNVGAAMINSKQTNNSLLPPETRYYLLCSEQTRTIVKRRSCSTVKIPRSLKIIMCVPIQRHAPRQTFSLNNFHVCTRQQIFAPSESNDEIPRSRTLRALFEQGRKVHGYKVKEDVEWLLK